MFTTGIAALGVSRAMDTAPVPLPCPAKALCLLLRDDLSAGERGSGGEWGLWRGFLELPQNVFVVGRLSQAGGERAGPHLGQDASGASW